MNNINDNQYKQLVKTIAVLFIFMQRSNSFLVLVLEIPLAKLPYSGQKFHGFPNILYIKIKREPTTPTYLTIQVVVCVFFVFFTIFA